MLGGPIPTPKQIRAYALERDYKGYLAERIEEAHRRAEPKRSAALRNIRDAVLRDLAADLARYREVVCELRKYRHAFPIGMARPDCADIHTAMSLKFAHLYNGFAHLNTLDTLPNEQLDLFGR
ncbi:hypothetical protein FJU08_22300 [Martelella alba]|uniref:Uncharacterized protein n=1 Tax=Martelella alba TaxID=2590451 RepID=A0A506U0B5_9HYPH|nr:hypothetical protein FJU08_22300 [Martelella alba]